MPVCYVGDPKRGEAVAEPIRRFGTPLGEQLGVQPFVAWQQAFDPLLTKGARNYWKSHNYSTVPDTLLDTIIEYDEKLPSPACEIFFGALGGAASKPAKDSTAYSDRDMRSFLNVHGRWESAAEDERCIQWARDFFRASAPFANGSVYVNFLTADEGERVRAAYGPNYHRLARVKGRYDPTNFFRMNLNIRPV